jgi:hypothetical protein
MTFMIHCFRVQRDHFAERVPMGEATLIATDCPAVVGREAAPVLMMRSRKLLAAAVVPAARGGWSW